MPNYREHIATDLIGSLASDDSDHIKPVDRVTAFAKAPRIGTLLWRIKYENDASCIKPATLLLARYLKHTNRGIAINIASHCIREWVLPMCFACQGSKHSMANELIVICPTCKGSGIARWDDTQRGKALGITADQARNFARLFKQLHDVIGAFDQGTNGIIEINMK